jgi:thioredoxin reductase
VVKGHVLDHRQVDGWREKRTQEKFRLRKSCVPFAALPSFGAKMNTPTPTLPVIVIGAGPVGLAAAVHLLERGETPLVLEAGASAGHTVQQWAHVRMFSPWRYAIDAAARRLLESRGWNAPDLNHLPTGGELVRDYLQPLAVVLAEYLHFNERVEAVTRRGSDKVRSAGRAGRPFSVRTTDASGAERVYLARAVIDASGTWSNPNPMGGDGWAALGEREVSELIEYGIPDVLTRRRSTYAGTTTLVVGSGHSAFNAVLDLLTLQQEVPDTKVVWAMRKQSLDKVFGGGAADALPARGELGQRARVAVEAGQLSLLTPFVIERVRRGDGGRVEVTGELAGAPHTLRVDRIIVATGFRPSLEMLREVRIDLDPWLESARALGPLIDPNEHSCGTVRPHGARELAHPEPDFYIVGMKSYGRAPTFLLATGYEQARSVVAQLAGDFAAAARVELNLPETGVCSVGASRAAKEGCCGGSPTSDDSACCKLDEEKKTQGEAGCGCGEQLTSRSASAAPEPALAARSSGCCA